MDMKDIRRANLAVLVGENDTIAEVARKSGTSEKYLWQILNQVQQRGTIRGIGDKLARKLEDGCGKPKGWMDVQHTSELGNQDAAFLERVRTELAGREIPEHLRQSILLMLHSAPKKDEAESANEPEPAGKTSRRRSDG